MYEKTSIQCSNCVNTRQGCIDNVVNMYLIPITILTPEYFKQNEVEQPLKNIINCAKPCMMSLKICV